MSGLRIPLPHGLVGLALVLAAVLLAAAAFVFSELRHNHAVDRRLRRTVANHEAQRQAFVRSMRAGRWL